MDLIGLDQEINQALDIIEASFRSSGKLLVAGNGGSAADADHIAGELLKGFLLSRRIPMGQRLKFTSLSAEETQEVYANLQQGLPVIPLGSFTAFMTAYINDENPNLIYAQLIEALGSPNDVFLGISTSGNSKNIIYGAALAKAKGLKVIALTGRTGGRLAEIADLTLKVPADRTPDIQELHLPLYHKICVSLEQRFFGRV